MKLLFVPELRTGARVAIPLESLPGELRSHLQDATAAPLPPGASLACLFDTP